MSKPRRTLLLACAAAALTGVTVAAPAQAGPSHSAVLPSLRHDLAAYYDFDHPAGSRTERELDGGFSGTPIDLVNGGAAMRVADDAFPGSGDALQTRQVAPDVAGNDDWKSGTYAEDGVGSLRAFGAAEGATVMGWFKTTGTNPRPDSTTPEPDDQFNAVGLVGVLSGGSDGHNVRALLELIDVDGELRLVALGRRLDDGQSLTFAADRDWRELLPRGEWVHLAATFDFDDGTMALYRDGRRLDGFYTAGGDPWQVGGAPEPDRTSATDPAGIKIGGSFPQNTLERNPCDCRFDSLMLLDRSLAPLEIAAQYHWMTRRG